MGHRTIGGTLITPCMIRPPVPLERCRRQVLLVTSAETWSDVVPKEQAKVAGPMLHTVVVALVSCGNDGAGSGVASSLRVPGGIFGLAPSCSMLGLHCSTQRSLLRRRLRRPRPAHRTRASSLAPRRHSGGRRAGSHPARHRPARQRPTQRRGAARRLPDRHLASSQARPRTCDHGVPVRLDDPQLPRPPPRRRATLRLAQRPPRRPLRSPALQWRPQGSATCRQDRPRNAPHRPQRPRPRRAATAGRPQRRAHDPLPSPAWRRQRGGPSVERPGTGGVLDFAKDQRLYPALHLAAHTGMRRGEVAGLKWSDLNLGTRRLSISRTVQSVAGTPTEFGAKTRTSRRCVDLDETTVSVLNHWRRRLRRDRLPDGADDWMFCNTKGRFLNPESLSQLFGRILRRSGLPRIRFTTCATRTRRCWLPTGSPSRS